MTCPRLAAFGLAAILLASCSGTATRGKKTVILYIGDSQTAGLVGQQIDRSLRARPDYEVYTYGEPGAVADNFLTGEKTIYDFVYRPPGFPQVAETITPIQTLAKIPTLAELIAKHHPDAFIIQLGGNFVGRIADPDWNEAKRTFTERNVNQLLDRVGGAPCLWIGPPDGRVRQKVNFVRLDELLTRLVPARGCKFVSLRSVGYTNLGDGAHPLDPVIVQALAQKALAAVAF